MEAKIHSIVISNVHLLKSLTEGMEPSHSLRFHSSNSRGFCSDLKHPRMSNKLPALVTQTTSSRPSKDLAKGLNLLDNSDLEPPVKASYYFAQSRKLRYPKKLDYPSTDLPPKDAEDNCQKSSMNQYSKVERSSDNIQTRLGKKKFFKAFSSQLQAGLLQLSLQKENQEAIRRQSRLRRESAISHLDASCSPEALLQTAIHDLKVQAAECGPLVASQIQTRLDKLKEMKGGDSDEATEVRRLAKLLHGHSKAEARFARHQIAASHQHEQHIESKSEARQILSDLSKAGEGFNILKDKMQASSPKKGPIVVLHTDLKKLRTYHRDVSNSKLQHSKHWERSADSLFYTPVKVSKLPPLASPKRPQMSSSSSIIFKNS